MTYRNVLLNCVRLTVDVAAQACFTHLFLSALTDLVLNSLLWRGENDLIGLIKLVELEN